MRRDCIARFVEAAESDDKIEVVLCDGIFVDVVHRANLPPDRTVFEGIQLVGNMLDESISWLPYRHFIVRFRGPARSAEFFKDAPVHFDFTAVVRSSLSGKVAYLHEPLVYTRWGACRRPRYLEAIFQCCAAARQVIHLGPGWRKACRGDPKGRIRLDIVWW